MKATGLAALLAALAIAAPALAQQQVATRITPDSGRLSLGTHVAREGSVYTIDGGTRAGPNLFHSFSQFDLGVGDAARWTWSGGGPGDIRNIISRVTGGAASTILGTIDSSALPNADFWFVNPAGIMFGAGARLDVPASAHFTTAQALRFADGSTFAVTTPGGSSFSIGPPSAYGFTGAQGAISLENAAGDLLPEGGRLSLVAGDVSIGDSDLPVGQLDLFAVGNGRTELDPAAPFSSPLSGRVDILSSNLPFSGPDGEGRGIRIGGGAIGLHSSTLGTDTASGESGAAAPIEIRGSDVTIDFTSISTEATGEEVAGALTVAGRNVLITGVQSVLTSAALLSSGDAGPISVIGDDIRIEDNASLRSTTFGPGNAGPILVQGGHVRIDGAFIHSDAEFEATGKAGSIRILGTRLDLRGGAEIGSQTFGFGAGGEIAIDIAGPVTIAQSFVDTSAEDVGAGGDGNAGRITIRSDSLALINQARVASRTESKGHGGEIAITTGSLSLDRAEISASSEGGVSGSPGDITIHAGDLELRSASEISTGTNNAGAAGAIAITGDRVRIVGPGSRISSTNFFEAGGAAGSVSITARLLSLIEGGSITTSATGGAAGDIVVDMPRDGLIQLIGRDERSVITTSSVPGTGGRILITTPRAIISDGGSILALGEQGGANVQIQTDFFIRTADRPNRVAVDGFFLLDAQVGDVSSGTVERDLSLLDASGVLRAQCAVARATGRISQLVIRPTGPYATGPTAAANSCR